MRNKRTGEYAAYRFETRTRFLVEVLEQIEARAGREFPVTLRISGYERSPGVGARNRAHTVSGDHAPARGCDWRQTCRHGGSATGCRTRTYHDAPGKAAAAGGSLVLAATVHSDNEYFLDFLTAEMRRLPITVELGVDATVAKVSALNADAAVELAEFIACRGRRVHLLETRNRISPEVSKKRPHLLGLDYVEHSYVTHCNPGEASPLASAWRQVVPHKVRSIPCAFASLSVLRRRSRLYEGVPVCPESLLRMRAVHVKVSLMCLKQRV